MLTNSFSNNYKLRKYHEALKDFFSVATVSVSLVSVC